MSLRTSPIALFIFRRDLRIRDNCGLNAALKSGLPVAPCFILDPRQIGDHPYRSVPGLQFMFEALIDLDQSLQEHNSALNLFLGEPDQVLTEILKTSSVKEIFFNRDYTPFAVTRDRKLHDLARKFGVGIHQKADVLLHEPETVTKADRTPYSVFTPFFKRALTFPVRSVSDLTRGKLISLPPTVVPLMRCNLSFLEEVLPNRNTQYATNGGSRIAKQLLATATKLIDYDTVHNLPALSGTSLLSPHNKFGTISIREVFSTFKQVLGADHPLVRQLFWRDFFYHIAHHFPHVFGHAFHREYDQLQWRESQHDLQRWCAGETGFPIVDAGMRQLNATGFMHNRVRMVVASFLVKDLHLDWRLGERYFATKLLDYDPCVNNGSWQWAASTGCDAQPYFRIFNPWLQQKRFDPECEYIKRWVPELRDLSAKQIHALEDEDLKIRYPKPIVDHAVAKVYAQEMFEAVKASTS